MSLAEYQEFNSAWFKDCPKCDGHFASDVSKDGLLAFFNRRKYYGDGLDYMCKACRQARNRKERVTHKRSNFYNAKYPEKRKARIVFSNAVMSGKIVRPERCSQCNKLGKIHGHHEDYSKPLDVIWLCVDCHAEVHNARR